LPASGYSSPAIAGSGAIACGIAASASATSAIVVLARSDESAQRAGAQARKLAAKVDGADEGRITVTTDPADLSGCDVVIEAIVEEPDPKADLLRTLGEAAPDADLATTTS
jgi:3-hydroxybutyryl-CoA dehydrogenase